MNRLVLLPKEVRHLLEWPDEGVHPESGLASVWFLKNLRRVEGGKNQPNTKQTTETVRSMGLTAYREVYCGCTARSSAEAPSPKRQTKTKRSTLVATKKTLGADQGIKARVGDPLEAIDQRPSEPFLHPDGDRLDEPCLSRLGISKFARLQQQTEVLVKGQDVVMLNVKPLLLLRRKSPLRACASPSRGGVSLRRFSVIQNTEVSVLSVAF